jgi:hypothetical protein
MHRDRQTSLTKEYMAGIAPHKPTVQWSPDIPLTEKSERAPGVKKPHVSKSECDDEELLAMKKQHAAYERFEKVYGTGSVPIEDDDATGEPADMATLSALRMKQLQQHSRSEDSGSEFSVGGYSGHSDTEYSDTEV